MHIFTIYTKLSSCFFFFFFSSEREPLSFLSLWELSWWHVKTLTPPSLSSQPPAPSLLLQMRPQECSISSSLSHIFHFLLLPVSSVWDIYPCCMEFLSFLSAGECSTVFLPSLFFQDISLLIYLCHHFKHLYFVTFLSELSVSNVCFLLPPPFDIILDIALYFPPECCCIHCYCHWSPLIVVVVPCLQKLVWNALPSVLPILPTGAIALSVELIVPSYLLSREKSAFIFIFPPSPPITLYRPFVYLIMRFLPASLLTIWNIFLLLPIT